MKKTTKKTTEKRGVAEDHPSFAAVVTAFAGDRNITRRKMFSSKNVLAVNGKIFAMLVKDKLVAKVPKERVDELVGGSIGGNFDPGHGRVMKEWVAVGAGSVNWVALAKEAYQFVKRNV